MPELKLARLPDRTPVKMTINVAPDLHKSLLDYAAAYKATYGDERPVAELVPHMLVAFLASDRGFVRNRNKP